MKIYYILPLCFMLSTVVQLRSTVEQASSPQVPTPQDNTRVDPSSPKGYDATSKAIDFFKAYVYAPSSKMLSNNIIEKLEIPELVKLIDNKIALTVDKILEKNKEAMSIYANDNDRTKIKAVYVEMASLYESLNSVEFRVKIIYPEQHMQKLFSVLQKIAAQQYKITYNPEEDAKSFWNIFTGE
jgi:hypothetical protein